MDLIHARGQTWVGCSYTDEEKSAMHAIAKSTGSSEFFAGIFMVVVSTLIVACVCVGAAFWHLNAKYGTDPSKTPGSEFFFCLALAAVTTIAGGLPLAMVIASAINSRVFPPSADTSQDTSFAKHVTIKSIRQIARMGAAVSAACLLGWLFLPQNSKFDTMLHLVMPTLGPLVSGLSGISKPRELRLLWEYPPCAALLGPKSSPPACRRRCRQRYEALF